MDAQIAQQLPVNFGAWPPLGQAALLFFSTFVLEDVAAIGAGLLLGAGALAWPTAFWACFLGIWLGDAGLYAIARLLGRGWFERSSWRRHADRIAASEQWFHQRGNAILVFSRLMPGARLPTYLAAGFLRLPLKRFLSITGSASLVWTIMILLLTQALGARLLDLLGAYKQGSLIVIFCLALVFLLPQLVKKLTRSGALRRFSTRLLRWTRWEFWPGWLFYPPVVLHSLFLAIKYRSLSLPTAANPGIFAGGIVGESKIETLRDLHSTSPDHTAEAFLISGGTADARIEALNVVCREQNIVYPFILKPDQGQRGVGVKLIRTPQQALEYVSRSVVPLVLQRYAAGPHEAGVFYYRFPHESRGHIFALTEKVFPCVEGDGKSTIAELIWRDERARFMAGKYLERLSGRSEEVLPAGEKLKLVEAGNHAQGCVFKDGMHLCTPELAARIDEISCKLDGFFVGRYDIRYASEEDLKAGRNFQIIELNGAASEATSIYDARNSLFAAYRTLFKQWDLVFAIGAANRRLGIRPVPVLAVWKAWRQFAQQAAAYPIAD